MPRLRSLTLLAFVLVSACADEGPIAGPGTLTATIVSPNGAEGAAVVTLLGDDVGSIMGVGGTEAHTFSGSGSTRVVLINAAGGELAFQVALSDTTQAPGFVLVEVAGPDDALRGSLVGYSLEFGQ